MRKWEGVGQYRGRRIKRVIMELYEIMKLLKLVKHYRIFKNLSFYKKNFNKKILKIHLFPTGEKSTTVPLLIVAFDLKPQRLEGVTLGYLPCDANIRLRVTFQIPTPLLLWGFALSGDGTQHGAEGSSRRRRLPSHSPSCLCEWSPHGRGRGGTQSGTQFPQPSPSPNIWCCLPTPSHLS